MSFMLRGFGSMASVVQDDALTLPDRWSLLLELDTPASNQALFLIHRRLEEGLRESSPSIG